jgi:hypothetical protein
MEKSISVHSRLQWEDEALDLNSKKMLAQSSAILWAIFPKLQIMQHYITLKNLGNAGKNVLSDSAPQELQTIDWKFPNSA